MDQDEIQRMNNGGAKPHECSDDKLGGKNHWKEDAPAPTPAPPKEESKD